METEAFLVDTNIWLERLLGQVHSDEVGEFLGRISSDQLFITDFTFHSIGVILSRLKRPGVLLRFTQDVLASGAVSLIHLEPADTERLVSVMAQFNLDFDDAYQYVAAEKFSLTIVSYDSHLDKTDRGRKTPSQI